eukprot:CAMPEP_0198250236 /NCGR_PEP_ID=MMETSP1447-20131203/1502_1 /TAXON_ID=420782 /ORGANISM="Chaetoceros dichaeta, Strain CCMP1751" /LENGTH=542 /DNA_ID=CAMNT_0043935043 /DNA_START=64 /DNA_END=1692 /DNA_ORIENTATION=+
MEDSTAGTPETAVPHETNGDAAQGDTYPDGARRERRQHTPSEELYDLSKPIPNEQKPDKTKHDESVEVFSTRINILKEKKQDVQVKIDDALEGGRNAEVMKERDHLKSLFNKKGDLIGEIKIMRSRLDMVRKQADNLINEKKQAKSNMRYGDAASIDAEIKKLKRRQETTSMSLGDEKRLIKEMEEMEKSKKFLTDVQNADISIDDVKEQRSVLQGSISAKNLEIDAVQAEIVEKQKSMDSMRATEDQSRNNLTSLKNERNDLSKQIGEVMDERNVARNEFRDANNKWYDYQRAVKARKKIQYDEMKIKETEEKEAYYKAIEEEEAKKVPYEEEKALCEYLVSYLTRTYLETGKKAAEEKVVEVIKVTDDPFAGLKPVNKKTDDMFLKIGKGPKKLRTRHSKKKAVPAFKLTVDSFEQFGFLSLSPPTKLEDVSKSIEELNAKKEWYKEQPRGSVPTVREIRKSNEKAAATARSSGTSNAKKSKGKLDIFGDDFAPLSTAAPTSAPVNALWGQKPVEELTEEAPVFDMGDAPALALSVEPNV